MPTSLAFRFLAEEHAYIAADTGEALPSITQMLARTGWVDDAWWSEEACERGRCVHELTASYDLGALDPATCVSKYRGWLLAYVAAMRALAPTWTHVEIPLVDPVHRFGGRPDRAGQVFGLRTVLEIKSGQPAKGDDKQTALQAILLASQGGLPAEHYERLALYLKPTGRFKLEQHKDRHDFDEARRIIRLCCQ